MKLFISCDMEGVAGIVDWEQCRPAGTAYAEGRDLLLGEVNAAIDGAVEGGATSILVNDSHGLMANLCPSDLSGEARYLSGRHKPLYMMQGLDPTFDAVFFVGYHGSMGSNGVLSHTYNPRAVSGVRLNGIVAGESALNALVALHHAVPVALLTGDQVAAEEARPFFPGVSEAVVKEAVTRFAADSFHPAGARRLIHETARRALERVNAGNRSLPAITIPTRLEVDWLTADMAELAIWLRGFERSGPRSTEAVDDDPLRLYRTFVAAVALTRSIVEA
jgi:D-amino peptidase